MLKLPVRFISIYLPEVGGAVVRLQLTPDSSGTDVTKSFMMNLLGIHLRMNDVPVYVVRDTVSSSLVPGNGKKRLRLYLTLMLTHKK